MKKIVNILLTVLTVLSLFGCGEKEVVKKADVIMPEKGQNITIDSKEYKVIKTNGTEAYLMLNKPYRYDVSLSDATEYENCAIDKACEEFYNNLSKATKDAIVEKTIDINRYEMNYEGFNDEYPCYVDYTKKSKTASLKRNVYIMDLVDIVNYFDGTFTREDIMEFLNNESDIPWLRTYTPSDESILGINGQSGELLLYAIQNDLSIRPCFEIDLNNVIFQVVE